MADSLQSDCDLSHSVVNLLNALYRGKLAYLNASRMLGLGGSPDEISRTQRAIESIQRWSQDLGKRLPLISTAWTMLETFESKKAFDLLEHRKNELLKLVDELASADPHDKRENEAQLVCCFVMQVYTKENFLKGMIEYATGQNREELAARYGEPLKEAGQEMTIANWLLKEFSKSERNADFEKILAKSTYLIRRHIRASIHDVKYMLSIYAGEFTYSLAEIDEQESIKWSATGIGPREAGYWKAFEMDAEESAKWQTLGVMDPMLAGRWKHSGFTPDSIDGWLDSGLLPEVATDWAAQGYSPEQAINQIRARNKRPDDV